MAGDKVKLLHFFLAGVSHGAMRLFVRFFNEQAL